MYSYFSTLSPKRNTYILQDILKENDRPGKPKIYESDALTCVPITWPFYLQFYSTGTLSANWGEHIKLLLGTKEQQDRLPLTKVQSINNLGFNLF